MPHPPAKCGASPHPTAPGPTPAPHDRGKAAEKPIRSRHAKKLIRAPQSYGLHRASIPRRRPRARAVLANTAHGCRGYQPSQMGRWLDPHRPLTQLGLEASKQALEPVHIRAYYLMQKGRIFPILQVKKPKITCSRSKQPLIPQARLRLLHSSPRPGSASYTHPPGQAPPPVGGCAVTNQPEGLSSSALPINQVNTGVGIPLPTRRLRSRRQDRGDDIVWTPLAPAPGSGRLQLDARILPLLGRTKGEEKGSKQPCVCQSLTHPRARRLALGSRKRQALHREPGLRLAGRPEAGSPGCSWAAQLPTSSHCATLVAGRSGPGTLTPQVVWTGVPGGRLSALSQASSFLLSRSEQHLGRHARI